MHFLVFFQACPALSGEIPGGFPMLCETQRTEDAECEKHPHTAKPRPQEYMLENASFTRQQNEQAVYCLVLH